MPVIKFDNLQKVIEAYQKAPNAVRRSIRLGVKDSLFEIQDYARHNHTSWTTRSGQAESAIEVDDVVDEGTQVSGAVFLDETIAKHVRYLHEGTGIHGPNAKYITILPVNRKCLRWVGSNGFVYAKRVTKNPGIKGDEFLFRAGDNNAAKINAIFNARVQQGLRGVGIS